MKTMMGEKDGKQALRADRRAVRLGKVSKAKRLKRQLRQSK